MASKKHRNKKAKARRHSHSAGASQTSYVDTARIDTAPSAELTITPTTGRGYAAKQELMRQVLDSQGATPGSAQQPACAPQTPHRPAAIVGHVPVYEDAVVRLARTLTEGEGLAPIVRVWAAGTALFVPLAALAALIG